MKINNIKFTWVDIISYIIIISAISMILMTSSCRNDRGLSDIDKELYTINIDSTSVTTIDKSFADTLGNKYSADADYFIACRDLNNTIDVLNNTVNTLNKTEDSLTTINILYLNNKHRLINARDSIKNYKESIKLLNTKLDNVIKDKDISVKLNIINREKLAVSDYKLLRIREYNRIAAQRNNLKYLRGWIIRVLDK